MYVERPPDLNPTYLTESAKTWAGQFAFQLEARRLPTFPRNIEVVWVLANNNLVVNTQRIETGQLIARAVTHAKKSQDEGRACGIAKLTEWDYSFFSPYFFQNGTLSENRQLRKIQLESPWQIPADKIIVADEFYNPMKDKNKPSTHENTMDQVTSFFQQITDANSPLYAKSEIAIVSSSSHFVRIPFYLKYAEEKFEESLRYPSTFYAYAISEGTEFGTQAKDELAKLARYEREKHLASVPSANIIIA